MLHSRKKISVAAALLLICAILLGTASYAWLTISTAPEISGIDTNIGANGGLEIALLTDATYMDPSLIRSSVGDSFEAENSVFSNETWGNIIDLSGSNYGLNQISLLPAQLNVKKNADGEAIVGDNMLVFPQYGVDGRSGNFYQDSVSAVYSVDEFTYNTQWQGYGVRAIGTASEMTVQQAALATARSQVHSYTSAATSAAISAWKVNGAAFIDIYERYYRYSSDDFTVADVAVIRDMAARTRNAINYIDLALRQGMVGYAASFIEDENSFKYMRTEFFNQNRSLSDVLNSYRYFFQYDLDTSELYNQLYEWANILYEDELNLQNIIYECDYWLNSRYNPNRGTIEWMLEDLLDPEYVYWNDDLLTQMYYVSSDNVLTLTEDAGPMAHIADFAGDYNTFLNYKDESSVEVTTLSFVEIPNLVQISESLTLLRAAAGDDTVPGVPLEDVYGFSVDLAFRCNTTTNLLLQTLPEDRVENTDEDQDEKDEQDGQEEQPDIQTTQDTQGAGSYIELYSETLGEERISRVMDAIRVGFLDNQNRLIALAKCIYHGLDEENGTSIGYLYLHNFNVADDGSISIGAPLKYATAITTLTESIPSVLTTVVWMDGDYVDNSLAAISGKTVDGLLNLQFSSSITLKPADLDMARSSD